MLCGNDYEHSDLAHIFAIAITAGNKKVHALFLVDKTSD